MQRLTVLDGLRAIAVLIVILSHAQLGRFIPGGFGVTIFFFLSGYLITKLLSIEFERYGSVSFRAFYLRRTVRIIPPMLICYAAAVALVLAGLVGRSMNFDAAVWDLLFLTNYGPPLPQSGIPVPLWSLDVEEHFYLLFPALFVLLLRQPPGHRALAVGALLVVALALRMFEFARGNEGSIFYWTHTRYDSILFGVLLTIDQARGRAWGRSMRWFLLGAALILISLVVRDPLFRETIRYSIQGLGLFFIFKMLLEGEFTGAQRLLGSYPLKRVADWSYVLYLIHMPLLLAAEHSFTAIPPPARLAMGLALAFAFAAAMERYVEKPLFAWRRRIEERLQPTGPLRPKGIE